MKLFILLSILIGFTLAAVGHFPTKAQLLPCITAKFDLNSDGTVTAAEIDTAFSGLVIDDGFMPPKYWRNSTHIINVADTNADGVLTIEDWNAAFSDDNKPMRSLIKQTCDLLNYTFS